MWPRAKICKKQAIFGILPTFWLFLASRKNFFIGVPSYLNLLIELIILVPNLMGLEKKLSAKFWCAKGIYYEELQAKNYFLSGHVTSARLDGRKGDITRPG